MNQFIICLFLFLLSSCSLTSSKKEKIQLRKIEGKVFGSIYEIKYAELTEKSQLHQKIEDFFKDFNHEFSTYNPHSVISRFNQLPTQKKLKVSPRFILMLKLATDLHLETKGAFDPSMGRSIQLWGFGESSLNYKPTRKDKKLARMQSGMKNIQWNEETLEVWKTHPLSLNLNAFAPGWAADLIGELLLKENVTNFMINIGGEILFKGNRSDGSPWTAGIETPDPQQVGLVQVAFKISNMALATSGNYRQFREEKGKIISHVLNPATHEPVTHQICSASVLADSAARADAWSTALMVMGLEGQPEAEKRGIRSYLIECLSQAKWQIHLSPSMQNYLNMNPPTH